MKQPGTHLIVHVNEAGYRVMAPLAEQAIAEALRGPGATSGSRGSPGRHRPVTGP